MGGVELLVLGSLLSVLGGPLLSAATPTQLWGAVVLSSSWATALTFTLERSTVVTSLHGAGRVSFLPLTAGGVHGGTSREAVGL